MNYLYSYIIHCTDMKLNANDIKGMVLECLSLLMETSIGDVYTRYYSDKIPQEMWTEMTNGTANITPFHRKVADVLAKHLVKMNSLDEDSKEILRETISDICILASKAWNSSDTARQFLTNTAKGNYYKYNNLSSLERFLRQICLSKKFSEGEFIGQGLYKIYEDDNMIVTATLSYSASHHFFGDSHWCTASDIGGEYNGFEMFKNYTEYDPDEDAEMLLLVQFVDKNDRQHSFQMSTYEYEPNLICDFEDHEVEIYELFDAFSENSVRAAISEMKKDFSKLTALTQSYISTEDNYYNYKEYHFVATHAQKIRERLNSPEFVQKMEEAFALNETGDLSEEAGFKFYDDIPSRFELPNGGYFQMTNVYFKSGNEVWSELEGNIINRANNLGGTDEFSDLGGYTAIFFFKDRKAKLIKKFKRCYIETSRGCVTELSYFADGSDKWVYSYVDVRDGSVLWSNEQEDLDSLHPGCIVGGNKDIFYLGKWVHSLNNQFFNLKVTINGNNGNIQYVNKKIKKVGYQYGRAIYAEEQ